MPSYRVDERDDDREPWELGEDFRPCLNHFLVVHCPGSMTIDELDALALDITAVFEKHCTGGTNEP